MRRIISRVLIEQLAIEPSQERLKLPDDVELLPLVEGDETAITNWCKAHNKAVTRIDYTTQKIFRSHPYDSLMCDVPQDAKSHLQDHVNQSIPLSLEEITLYTQGRWWKAIELLIDNENPLPTKIDILNNLCYRALKTLQSTPEVMNLEETSKILSFCGFKIASYTNQDPSRKYEIYTKDTGFANKLLQAFCNNRYIPHVIAEGDLQRLLSTSLKAFLESLPEEDQILCTDSIATTIDFLSPLVFAPTLNKLWFQLAGNDTMLVRPGGGYAHRNRFASALDRMSATYLPGLTPPSYIHDNPCDAWHVMTMHDVTHLIFENHLSYKEAWIHLAWHLLQQTKNEDLYNHFLDRVSSFALGTGIKERMKHSLSRFTTERAKTHENDWQQEHETQVIDFIDTWHKQCFSQFQ